MTTLRHDIRIDASPTAVWKVVHEQIERAPEWAPGLRRAEVIGGGKPGVGTRLRYTLALPGGRNVDVEMIHTEFDRPHRCAGEIVSGPLRGPWAYEYEREGRSTVLTYTMELSITGALRLASHLITSQYDKSVRETLESLKRHVETEHPPARSKS